MPFASIVLIAAAAISSAAPSSVHRSTEFLVGHWEVVAVDPASDEPLRLCYAVAPFVGNRWLVGTGSSQQIPFDVKDIWGQDPQTSEIMRTVYDSTGTIATVRSPGWKGDVLVLEGEARSSSGAVRIRETITVQSADSFRAVWEAQRGGKWQAYSIETVTRAKSGACLQLKSAKAA